MSERYSFRQYRPDDREAFLSLHGTVFGGDPDDAWFEWKFEDNPAVDEVQMIVAETDGDLVGAIPYFVQRLRLGDRTALALQPGDVMVHPDHRRKGLFTRMSAWGNDYYEPREPALALGFPNAQALPGWLETGWTEVGDVSTYYRVESPSALKGSDAGNLPFALLERVGDSLAGGYLYGRGALADSGPDDISVERHSSVPADVLSAVYESGVPDRVHTERTAPFYRWRYQNPQWEYTTYVAKSGEEPVAGIIVGSRDENGAVTAKLVEVVPVRTDESREPAIRRLVSAILDDNSHADVIVARAVGIPPAVLSSFGFHPDDAFPLSRVTDRTTLIARGLRPETEGERSVAEAALSDPENWLVSLSEQDTS